jgi:hypothetical protein
MGSTMGSTLECGSLLPPACGTAPGDERSAAGEVQAWHGHPARVSAWAGSRREPPAAPNDSVSGPALLDLAVEALVRDARRWFFRRQEQPGGLGKPTVQGERYRLRVEEACEQAAALTDRFHAQLLQLLLQDLDGFHRVVQVARCWIEASPQRGGEHGEYFAARLADWLAVALVGSSLRRVAGWRGDLVWDLLFQRVARRVILPRLRVEATEDRVRDCVAAMLASAGRFQYREPGQAVAYLTTAYRLRNRAETVPEATLIDLWIAVDVREREQTPVGGGAPPAVKPPGCPCGWSRVAAAVGAETAQRLWILATLREDRSETWETIAELVLQPHCRILGDNDLPPGASWDEVSRAFQSLAQRSRARPGLLNAGALKNYYCRTRQRVLRSQAESLGSR